MAGNDGASQRRILDMVIEQARQSPDREVLFAVAGECMVGVRCEGSAGVATRVSDTLASVPDIPSSAHELAGWLAAPPPGVAGGRCWGMAAVNALLPEPGGASTMKGQDIIASRGQGAHVAVVGHFPFLNKLKDRFASISILEKNPRPGDLPASDASRVLPAADVIAITGTTLLNGTLAGLLALCRPESFVFLMGPSTPLAPVLFDCGVNALAGTLIEDASTAMDGVGQGFSYKRISGVRPVVLEK